MPLRFNEVEVIELPIVPGASHPLNSNSTHCRLSEQPDELGDGDFPRRMRPRTSFVANSVSLDSADMTVGWACTNRCTVDMETFERGRRNRSFASLILPRAVRKRFLEPFLVQNGSKENHEVVNTLRAQMEELKSVRQQKILSTTRYNRWLSKPETGPLALPAATDRFSSGCSSLSQSNEAPPLRPSRSDDASLSPFARHHHDDQSLQSSHSEDASASFLVDEYIRRIPDWRDGLDNLGCLHEDDGDVDDDPVDESEEDNLIWRLSSLEWETKKEHFLEAILPICEDRVYHLQKYSSVIVGSEAVDALIDKEFASTRDEAVYLARLLGEKFSLFEHVHQQHCFSDGHLFYRFTKATPEDTRQDGIKSPSSSEIERLEQKAVLLAKAQEFRRYIKLRDRNYHFKTYKDCFVAKDIIDDLVENDVVQSRSEAVALGQALSKELGMIQHVCGAHQFDDSYLFFNWLECKTPSSS